MNRISENEPPSTELPEQAAPAQPCLCSGGAQSHHTAPVQTHAAAALPSITSPLSTPISPAGLAITNLIGHISTQEQLAQSLVGIIYDLSDALISVATFRSFPWFPVREGGPSGPSGPSGDGLDDAVVNASEVERIRAIAHGALAALRQSMPAPVPVPAPSAPTAPSNTFAADESAYLSNAIANGEMADPRDDDGKGGSK